MLKVCSQNRDITEAYLHVHVDNTEAIEFYKKFDFDIKETVPNYYSKLTPSSAVLLSKQLQKNL